jgi:hypothetical protein
MAEPDAWPSTGGSPDRRTSDWPERLREAYALLELAERRLLACGTRESARDARDAAIAATELARAMTAKHNEADGGELATRTGEILAQAEMLLADLAGRGKR